MIVRGRISTSRMGGIVRTDITQIIIQDVLAEGIDSTVREVLSRLESRALEKRVVARRF